MWLMCSSFALIPCIIKIQNDRILWRIHFYCLHDIYMYLSVYSRECQGEAHEPCDCEIWKLWLQKVSEMRPEECEYWHEFFICSFILLFQSHVSACDKKYITLLSVCWFIESICTVNHVKLLQNLTLYSLSGTELLWFKSNLSYRKKFISWNNSSSDYRLISSGVPQGSILGPLLIVIYLN